MEDRAARSATSTAADATANNVTAGTAADATADAASNTTAGTTSNATDTAASYDTYSARRSAILHRITLAVKIFVLSAFYIEIV